MNKRNCLWRTCVRRGPILYVFNSVVVAASSVGREHDPRELITERVLARHETPLGARFGLSIGGCVLRESRTPLLSFVGFGPGFVEGHKLL